MSVVQKNYVSFNNHALTDFGVYISGTGIYGSAERDYEEVEVPGRNGSVYLDNNRFKNVEVTYPAFILGGNFSSDIANLRAFLGSSPGYHRLDDTYYPNEYRMAIYAGPFEPEVHDSLEGASFDLTFICKPQRFLKSGDNAQNVSSGDTIYNPTYYTSKPLIRVVGSGTITINSVSVQINENSDYTDLDCELEDAYHNNDNRNGNVVTPNIDYPSLVSGANTITYSGFTSVTITPRWWTI